MIYDFVDELQAVGAIKQGHFLLASGKHSDRYIEKFDLLRYPAAAQRACEQLIRNLGGLADVQLVAGPTTGGILLAFEIGRQLGLPAAYAERLEDGASSRVFKRGTVIEPGTTVLVVDDVLTTGGSIRETLRALEAQEADIRAVAVLVDRSGGTADFGVPLISLAHIDIEAWEPDECPLCEEGRPLQKPGTSHVIDSIH